MSQETPETVEKDIRANWVTSSRFFILRACFCIVSFVLGGCYKMYNHRYQGKPEVEVQKSSQYTPEYK
jgi:hypothetical protein